MPSPESPLPSSGNLVSATGHSHHRLAAALGVSAAALLLAGVAWTGASPAYAAEATVGLGTAKSFAVLAGSEVTNTGRSVISGDLGIAPGAAVSGFPPGRIINGTMHVADGVAIRAKNDLTTAYNDAAGRSASGDVTGTDLGGRTLVSGVYEDTSGMQLTGTVTLDAQGDPNAVFIFQAGSTLITASNSTVALTNGASPCNVFWQVGSSATLGTGTHFVGTILALTSATLNSGADVEGRVLARNGAVTLDTNDITAPGCAAPPPSSTATPSATATATNTATATPTAIATPTASPTSEPSSTGKPGDGGSDGPPDNPSDSTGLGTGGPDGPGGPAGPTVPVGHPHTGLDPSPGDRGFLVLYGLAALGTLGALVAFGRAVRTPHTH
jgi:hypothetical protein